MSKIRGAWARVNDERRRRVAARGSGIDIAAGARIGPGVSIRATGSGRVFIGPGVQIAEGTSLSADDGATLRVGRDVFIAQLCVIAAKRSISVGDEAMIAEMVCIRDHDHDPSQPPRSGRMLTAVVEVGNRAWLGSKSSIVRGGSVGADSVIGAHALVNRPIPPGVLAVGVPARVKKACR